MLGFCALATAALGTDGGVYVQVAVPGVAASASVGTLSGDATAVQLTGVAGSGMAASLPASGSLAVGCISVTGVAGETVVALVTPNVAADLGAFPITSDGVLGLWALGDATPGIDAPPENLFVGVVGNGTCSPLAAFVDNSVAANVIAGPVIADPGAGAAGVTLSAQTGQLAPASILGLIGVAATGFGSAAFASMVVPVGLTVAQGYAGFVGARIGSPATGVSTMTAYGLGSVDDPGASISGRAATAAPGVFLSHSPSSAFALWGAPVPGGSATVAFTGLPSITVTFGTGQTAAQVASSLAALINANTALVTAGLSARTANNLVELHQPQPAAIASAVSFYGT